MGYFDDHNDDNDGSPGVLIETVIDHNSVVAKKLAPAFADDDIPQSWAALADALGRAGVMEKVLAGHPGNSSERLVLAALLLKAGYARQADKLCPDFFTAWAGLDPFNGGLIADVLADEG